MRRLFSMAMALVFLIASANVGSQSMLRDTASLLAWRPLSDFGDIFPSYVLITSTMTPPQSPPQNYLGDPFGLIGIEVENTSPNTNIRGVIEMSEIAERTEFSYALPHVGQYRIYPKIGYRFQQLSRIRQPITVNLSISVAKEGEPLETKTHSIRVRSVNDAVLSVRLPSGRVTNKMWALAGFVNENHPAIDGLLREALNLPVPIVREFVGYQSGQQEVINQVFAIWYLFQRHGFTYSSITTPTGASTDVQSQFVRFFEDSIRTQQANCIDGTVLFASILRRIGIDPIIVLRPGHAYLGFWLDKQHSKAAFLETTAMNTAQNPYRDQKPTQFRDAMARMFQTDLKLRNAALSFTNALAIGQERYREDYANLQASSMGYMALEIDKMRLKGVQPINH